MNSSVIHPFSPVWWIWNGVFIGTVALFIGISFLFRKEVRAKMGRYLGIYLLGNATFLQIYLIHKGLWTLQNGLPLHFCDLMLLFSTLALLTRWPFCYEVSLFLGLIAPMQAMITPALAFGWDPCYVYTFFANHTILIITPLFLTFSLSMRPRKRAWWKTALVLSTTLPLIMGMNWLLGGNYMFLSEKPDVDHFCNLGPWPLYIIYWIALLLVISFLIHITMKRLCK